MDQIKLKRTNHLPTSRPTLAAQILGYAYLASGEAKGLRGDDPHPPRG